MKTIKNESEKDKYGVDFSESYIDSASATECTGLIPSLPQSDAEIESYDEVYQFLPKAKAKNVKDNL